MSLFLIIIIPLIGTAIEEYFVFREIQLDDGQKLIQECIKKEHCPGRISALERLVKAKRSLKSYNLSGADLSGADLSGADLRNANLYNVNLSGADLSDAILLGALFSFADLSNANLRNTYLRNADFYIANLDHANLDRANLIRTKNLTSSKIKLTCYWEQSFYKGYFDYENQEWIVDEEANKQYIKELKLDKASDPKEPVDCSRWN